ncbi:class I SAM-dependent methyltransferase [Nonomuraea sp. NPDC050394]|uniref:class I SAM-dependent methyltransferase n=1 Tax=Nonomuraea sp. NPDC050394 TaxID=3364363 RepID=UPI0037AEED1D
MSEHEEFWDARYSESRRIWSGQPNTMLVTEVEGMAPGRALDLGCGEGGDVVWLARRGWRVTGVDVSRVALERAGEHAKEAGVADLVDLRWHQLGESFPEGEFDLVSAAYLHSKVEMSREKILRAAAAAVAPGGVLLVLGHSGGASWQPVPPPDMHFPTPREVYDSLGLAQGAWVLERSGEFERSQNGPDGEPGTRTDNVLRVRRLPA